MKKIIFVVAMLVTSWTIYAQDHVQTFRGTVVDKESQMPLTGANIMILESDPMLGTSTDFDGTFRIENVPIGRKTISISYLGYEPLVAPNILITTGKEVVMEFELTESLVTMDEVVVTAENEKTRPINEMAVASARSFSVEETGRYASSLFDPARMAQNFAGISTTGGTSDLFNEIIVRGNSPRGVLWRLEGIEIPNPNHFGGLGNSGGGISMLSSSMLSSSDFYTGAFPAEFGNATSGVFDLNLRKGNNQKREHSLMVGILGTEVASEGPFGKPGGASYLVNFRYSTLGILQKIGLNPVGDVLPEYGDLSFNLNFPRTGAGTFNLFALAGKNIASFDVDADSTLWEYDDDHEGFEERQTVATVGLGHRLLLSDNSYLHTVVAASVDRSDDDEYYLDKNDNYRKIDDFQYQFSNYIYRVTSTYHKKLNNRNTFEVGGIASYHKYDFFARDFYDAGTNFETYLQDTGSAGQLQGFIQWKHRINESWTLTGGIHANYYALSKHGSIEPRIASKWTVNDATSFHMALGMHSKPEHPVFHLAETVSSDGEGTFPNKNLDYLKSLHAVAGYDHYFSKDLRIKAEVYYQHLYDVPVEESNDLNTILNVLDVWDALDVGKSNNSGKGRNYGIDLTLEKTFSKSYYFLMTGSLFSSKFKTPEGKWFNTRFNSGYQLNLLGGKEFVTGQEKNKIFGLNGKFVINGGNRVTPIDLAASREENRSIRDFDNYLGESIGTYYRFDIGISYKINKKSKTHSIMLDIQNVTNRLNPLGQYYRASTQNIEFDTHTGLFPVLNYRLEF